MPVWTKEQSDAIYKSDTNIIVSAGAGSGKTAVLTERVIEKLNQGIHINELLILTFTKTAAGEMKERIRLKINKKANLRKELTLLDSAYITTFDAFALSLVKKYHYLLNTSVNLQITNETIIELLRKETMRKTLDSFYESQEVEFTKFISDFCVKDDKDIYKSLLEISKKLEQQVARNKILTYYKTVYGNEEKLEEYLKEYTNLLCNHQNRIKEQLQNFSHYAPKDYQEKCESSLFHLLNESNIDTIYQYKSSKLPPLPRAMDELVKEKKEELNASLKEFLSLLEYGPIEQLKKDFSQMQSYITIICKILKKYFDDLEQNKQQKKYYDFNDIAFLAAKLIDENPEIQQELQNKFHEIMIDEYQDTNDIQENFIKKISKQNVYMVGDMKQSIYRFRNANPKLFKKKYDAYREEKGGLKIDLVKNFRSRKDVLQNINLIFNQLMDDEIGGADYLSEHQMIFGNKDYETYGTTKESYQMEIKTYELKKDTPFTKEEIEIFLIGRDIQKKWKENYLVYDKENQKAIPCSYKDFVILMDRTTNFNQYKKIFNYLKIPISLYKDEILNNSMIFSVIKNILQLLHSFHQKNFDKKFQYSFVSIARSFLFSYSDQTIYEILQNHTWYQNSIYETLKPILIHLSSLSLPEIIEEIYIKTKIYEKIINIADIKENMLILNHIQNLSEDYGIEGNNLSKFVEFLNQVQKEEIDLKYSAEASGEDSVKIMTIHKSKGLEFPICYMSGLYKTFNIKDMKEPFLYDSKYGIITPIKEEGLSTCFIKELVKNQYLKEEISEKIRLLYVATTRAKEKMIFLLPSNSDKIEHANTNRLKSRSFQDFFYNIWDNIKAYQEKINIEELNISRDYLFQVQKDLTRKKAETIQVQEINMSEEIQEKQKFSKESFILHSKEDQKNIQLGLKIHEYLEDIDFQYPNYEMISETFLRWKVKKFITSPIIQEHKHCKMWKEYEFIYEKDQKEYHGIIDLLIETDHKMIIIDYKLNNILDDSYQKQLQGYQQYIEMKTNKPVETYLYSIITETITPINKTKISI